MVQTNNLPDILNLNTYASYAADGLLYSGDEVLPKDTAEDIIPAFVNSGTYKGKFYGMPDLSSARGAVSTTRDLFSQGRHREAADHVGTSFRDDAKKVTALGNGAVGYAQPLGPGGGAG